MSARRSRKNIIQQCQQRKHQHKHNTKPYHTKQNSSKPTKTNSSQTSSKKTSQKNQYQISDTFAYSYHKINDQSFYKNNPALTNKKKNITRSKSNPIYWKQEVNQHSNSYSESLTIRFECDPKINSSSCKPISNEKGLWNQYSKSKNIFTNTMCQLFQPYIQIQSIINIILEYNGPHLLPIRYSIDLLPYFHQNIRSIKPRIDAWNSAIKSSKTSECVLDFIPNNNILVVEDIYDEWVEYIRQTFGLRKKLSEMVLFYIPKYKSYMEIGSGNISNETQQKQIFSEYYMKELNNFSDCNEYAFKLQLYGINYRYYLQKREYSPISWGSRSRCWDGNGMVLLSNGKQKQIKYLNVGDKVKVLNTLPNGLQIACNVATVKVKIESIVNRKYEMVCVNDKMWITPYHAVVNVDGNKWEFPCQIGEIEERFVDRIYNFILDDGHVLCVNGIWACTLGHDFKGEVIENPMWGSSYVMDDMWSKKDGYPNVVEYI